MFEAFWKDKYISFYRVDLSSNNIVYYVIITAAITGDAGSELTAETWLH